MYLVALCLQYCHTLNIKCSMRTTLWWYLRDSSKKSLIIKEWVSNQIVKLLGPIHMMQFVTFDMSHKINILSCVPPILGAESCHSENRTYRYSISLRQDQRHRVWCTASDHKSGRMWSKLPRERSCAIIFYVFTFYVFKSSPAWPMPLPFCIVQLFN